MKSALLVVDVQKGMFAFPEYQPARPAALLDTIANLIARARSSGVPVIFVKHDGREPGHPLARENPLHAIADEVAPRPDELVVTKVNCSAFLDTDLESALRKLGVERVVVCGMQTDFCVDTGRAGWRSKA